MATDYTLAVSSTAGNIYTGMSTGTKPAAGENGCKAGDIAIETDTGNKYEFDGGTWRSISVGGAVKTTQVSASVDTGGTTERKAISTTSIESTAITTGSALVTASVDCFVRQGTAGSNTAVAPVTDTTDGDALLLADNTYRIDGITSGNTLAFVTEAGTGTVTITPGA